MNFNPIWEYNIGHADPIQRVRAQEWFAFRRLSEMEVDDVF